MADEKPGVLSDEAARAIFGDDPFEGHTSDCQVRKQSPEDAQICDCGADDPDYQIEVADSRRITEFPERLYVHEAGRMTDTQSETMIRAYGETRPLFRDFHSDGLYIDATLDDNDAIRVAVYELKTVRSYRLIVHKTEP